MSSVRIRPAAPNQSSLSADKVRPREYLAGAQIDYGRPWRRHDGRLSPTGWRTRRILTGAAAGHARDRGRLDVESAETARERDVVVLVGDGDSDVRRAPRNGFAKEA